jgi:thiamine-phosphate pyrophosphorylase
MDAKLFAWARGVKARARSGPALWLFTDATRLADPIAAARGLPRGHGGVVLRDDLRPDRRALALALARVCRERRLRLAVAGDWRLAALVGAGVHLRGGRRPQGMPRWLTALTSSAHGKTDLVRARQAAVRQVFLSPVFPTASHPGVRALGPVRWGLAAPAGGRAGALGGIDGRNVRRLPAKCRAVGAIAALA